MLVRALFWFIILANLGGAAFGFFVYYPGQLTVTNPLLWIFVVDCPLAALLFALAFYFRGEARPGLLRQVFGKVPSLSRKGLPDLSWLWFIAFVGAVKYGFWTVFVLAAYPDFYFTPGAVVMYAVLFGAHLFLIFETIFLVGKIKVRERYLCIALVWFLANDLSDYILGTHPPLPGTSLAFMLPATVAMSVVFTLLGYLVLVRYSREFRVL